MTELEALANEFILGLFEFLDTAHLIQTFYGLNSRFNHLLYAHFRIRQLNFQSITNTGFHIICQQYLPFVINQIRSLRIGDDTIFNLSSILLSHGFTLDRFIHLKSLSLYHIYSLDTIHQIILQCHHLSHLNHLSIINCYTDNLCKDIVNINNQIWNLPKLKYFNLNDLKVKDTWLLKISVVSSSIEYLSIETIDGYSIILYDLFKCTPHLRQLNINVICWRKYVQPEKIIFSSIISLKTSFKNDVNLMTAVFKKMPNLCYLTLETEVIYMDGYQWENFLVNHLTKIKIFRLKMNFSYNDSFIQKIDKLLDSFRTSFWLEEHRWFVQCDCFNSYGRNNILYTLPNIFDKVSLNPQYSKSTDPNIDNILLDNRVQFFHKNNIKINSFNNLSLYTAKYSNIHQLELSLPFIDTFDSYTLLLDQLTSLNVTLANTLAYDHLQILLDQSSKLNLLKFNSFGEPLSGLSQLRSSSIRQLDLIEAQEKYVYYHSRTACYQLMNSPIRYQCEILLIHIENLTSISNLIEKMPNLQLLIVKFRDNILTQWKLSAIEQDFVEWLKSNLSSTYSISTDPKDTSLIRIQINR